MDRKEKASTFITIGRLFAEASVTVKVIMGIIAFVGVMSTLYATSKALLAMPVVLAKHAEVTEAGFKTLDKMLCIQVADHRQMDWRLCYIDPSQVVPKDGSH